MIAIIDAFRQHLATRHAPRTVKTYGAIAAAFLAFSTPDGSDAAPTAHEQARVEAFLARPTSRGDRRAASTRNQELAALRRFAQFAERALGWEHNPTDGIPFEREPPRDPPVLGLGEVRTAFEVIVDVSSDRERARNLAIMAVLVQLGLRVHELIALNLEQVDVPSSTLIGIHGKGGTVHDLPLNPGTLALIFAWMTDREEMAGEEERALFVSSTGRRISIRSVQRLVAKMRDVMGTAKHITPHTFRHTCATLALTLGTDLSTVSDLLRHADLNTTRRYLHLVDERRREAVGKLEAALPPNLMPGVIDAVDIVTNEPSAPTAPPTMNPCTPSNSAGDASESVHGRTTNDEEKPLDVQQRLGDTEPPPSRRTTRGILSSRRVMKAGNSVAVRIPTLRRSGFVPALTGWVDEPASAPFARVTSRSRERRHE